jgi:hypothetical protein
MEFIKRFMKNHKKITFFLIVLIIIGIYGAFQWQQMQRRERLESDLEELGIEYTTEALFEQAITFENEEAIEIFLKLGTDIDVKNDESETPLIFAAKNDMFDMVDFLVDKGADVSVTDDEGKTALMWAVESNNEAMVEKLLEKVQI